MPGCFFRHVETEIVAKQCPSQVKCCQMAMLQVVFLEYGKLMFFEAAKLNLQRVGILQLHPFVQLTMQNPPPFRA